MFYARARIGGLDRATRPARRERLHARGVAFSIAVLDTQVVADRPALSFKTLFEGLGASFGPGITCEAY